MDIGRLRTSRLKATTLLVLFQMPLARYRTCRLCTWMHRVLRLCPLWFATVLPAAVSSFPFCWVWACTVVRLTHVCRKFSDNHLNGTIPKLSNLTSLTELRLNNNNLSGPLPGFLKDMQLTYINLSFNQLSGSLLEQYSAATPVGVLLNNNKLSGTIPSALQHLNLTTSGLWVYCQTIIQVRDWPEEYL